jgi:adenylosuccinate lyase
VTPDQARRVAELIGNAKNQLLDALRVAERSSSAQVACQIGTLCGRVETLQRKVSLMQEPKKQTLRQFARQHRL